MNETNVTANRPLYATVTALFPGVFVLLLGVVSLLVSIGVLHVSLWQIWRYWPVFLILLGLINLLRADRTGVIWGLATALYGVFFLMDNLGRLPFHAWKLWPIFVVAFGAQWLLATLQGDGMDGPVLHTGSRRHPLRSLAAGQEATVIPGQPLQIMAIFSEAHARVVSPDLVGGQAFSMFGLCKIDLRAMGVPEQPVTIYASAFFGAIEIYVPGTWDVMLRGVGMLGAYQDETMPMPLNGREGERHGLLVVRGLTAFAAVTIKN